MRPVLFSLALLSSLLGGLEASPAPLAGLEDALAATHFPGACTAVAHAGQAPQFTLHGYADVARRQPYTAETVQPVGSVSKTVIGLALMRAVELGLVTLDAPIAPLLDFRVANPRFPREALTLRQLATHTSGIVDQEAGYLASYRFGRSQPDGTLRQYLIDYLSPGGKLYKPDHYAAARPGTAFHYSNVGSALAAYVIERRVGEPFAAFATREVLQPLGMASAGWFAKDTVPEAALYSAERRPVGAYTSVNYPDGSLRASCADMTRYLQALMAGHRAGQGGPAAKPLSAASWRELFRPQFPTEGVLGVPTGLRANEPQQGLFFAMRRDGSIGHTGSDYGVSAFLFFQPDTGVGKYLVTNVDVQDDEALPPQFAKVWKLMGE